MVRQDNSIVNRDEPTDYTTALTLMQIMHEKGILKRDATVRTHAFADDMH